MNRSSRCRRGSIPRQRGFALLLLVVIALLASLGLFFGRLGALTPTSRGNITTDALARAKEALIAYAVSTALESSCTTGMTNCARPGDLPCPDRDDDGVQEFDGGGGCGNGAGTTFQERRLGRLPWRTLGISDLRDETGERLWYAVSTRFKQRTRSGAGLELNSDTPGTITLRNAAGNVIFAATAGQGVVAVIIAPGAPLTRSEPAGNYTQNRDAAGHNDPRNYLDRDPASGEDNMSFVDGGADGFSEGPIRDGAGNVLSNDRVVVVTGDEILAAIERRVAREALLCMQTYAAATGTYPWPVPLADAFAGEVVGREHSFFGRIPDSLPADLNPLLDAASADLTTARNLLDAARAQLATLTGTSPAKEIADATTDTLTAANNAGNLIANADEAAAAAYTLSKTVADAAAKAKTSADLIATATAADVLARAGSAAIDAAALYTAMTDGGVDSFPALVATRKQSLQAARDAYQAVSNPVNALALKAAADTLGNVGTPSLRPYSTPNPTLSAALASLTTAANVASAAAFTAAVYVYSGTGADLTADHRTAAINTATSTLGAADNLLAEITAARISVTKQQVDTAAAAFNAAVPTLATTTLSNATTVGETLRRTLPPLQSFLAGITTSSATLTAKKTDAVNALAAAKTSVDTLLTSPTDANLSAAKPATAAAQAALSALSTAIAANGDNLSLESLTALILVFNAKAAAYPGTVSLGEVKTAAADLASVDSDIQQQASIVVGSGTAATSATAAAASRVVAITTAEKAGQTGSALVDETLAAVGALDNALTALSGLQAAKPFFRQTRVATAVKWPASCAQFRAGSGSWWTFNNWREHILVQISDASAATAGVLTVNGIPGHRVVVLAQGRALAGQLRPSANAADYVEGINADASRSGVASNPVLTFEQRTRDDTFNDQLAH